MTQRRALPKICIALGLPDVPRLLEQARREAEAGENFLEFRLAHLRDPALGARAIAEFLQSYPNCTILATCRRHQNHGKFNGSIEEQLRILEAAIAAGAQAIDVEVESAEGCGKRLEALRSRTYLLLSYHNYGGTPPMEPVMRRMMRIPADGYKIVTTAKKPSDNCRVLDLARSHAKVPTVILAMGEAG